MTEIKASLVRLADTFIPREIFEFYHEEDKWKARSVVFVLLINMLLSLFGYIAHLIGNVTPENFSLVSATAILIDILGYCLAIFMFRFSLPYSVVASVYGITAISSLWLMLSVAEIGQLIVINQLFYVIPLFVYIISGFAVAVVWIVISLVTPQIYVALFAAPDILDDLDSWSFANSYFVYISMSILFYVVDSYRRQITNRLNFERMEFEFAAAHDNLTGLANRSAFEKRFSDALEGSKFTGDKVVLALIDLDGFKPINDQYGHHAGDEVLKEISQRLLDTMRTTDTVARLGGDEFAVIFSKLNDLATTQECLKRVVDSLAQPIRYENTSLIVSGSIGVAIAPEHGTEISELLRKADSAMYIAKEEKGRYLIYSEAS